MTGPAVDAAGVDGPPYALIECELPWCVAPSTPLLELHANETAVVTRVTLAAWFGPRARRQRDRPVGVGSPTALLVTPEDLETSLDPADLTGEYQRLELAFEDTLEVRMRRLVHNALDPGEYIDPMAEPVDPATFMDPDPDMARWVETGVCPFPRVYRVGRPPIGGRHVWLVVGEDAVVEVLARGWTWRSLGTLRGW